VLDERTATNRYFDLRPSGFLAALVDSLVVEWDTPRLSHRRAASVSNMPVLEIADRDKVPFSGFDLVLLNFQALGEMVSDDRYAEWRTALSQVQGIYLITSGDRTRDNWCKVVYLDGREMMLPGGTAPATVHTTQAQA
jgi:hypothetical protein